MIPPGIKQAGLRAYKSYKARQTPDEVLAQCRENAELRNNFQGKRCFILASGSSINEQDLRPLADEYCIGMSMFFLHDKIQTIAPEFYVFAPNHPPYDFELPRQYLTGFNDRLDKRTKLFLGHRPYEYSFYQFLQRNPSAEPPDYTYINYSYSPGLTEKTDMDPSIWDISHRPFGVRTTFIAAIQIAAYLGFSEICLLGTDYDYLEQFEEEGVDHFYDDENGINEVRSSTKEEVFLGYHHSWKQFRLVKEYLSTRGQYIYNATAGGMLDVFPRVSLEAALEYDQLHSSEYDN
jgi:hypothetical protein